jgi:hypothetical protein
LLAYDLWKKMREFNPIRGTVSSGVLSGFVSMAKQGGNERATQTVHEQHGKERARKPTPYGR